MLDKITRAGYFLFFVLFIAITLLVIVSVIPVPGNYQLKIVKSGSMEPAIMTGSVVVLHPGVGPYAVGDVITYGARGRTPTTHRVVEVKGQGDQVRYVTRGDANNTPDLIEVTADNVVGKVVFSIPVLGYILDFAKKPFGFVIMIGIPSLVIIADEAGRIWREIKSLRRKSAGPADGKTSGDLD